MFTLSMNDYEITRNGDVINKRNGRKLKPQQNGKGYLRVYIGGKLFFVHRLVAELYVENPNNKTQVNHKDGNKLNNNAENLEWVSNIENRRHAIANGLHKCGEDVKQAKLTEENVVFIRTHIGQYNSVQFAKMFGVSRSAITNVIHNKTWKQLKRYAELP